MYLKHQKLKSMIVKQLKNPNMYRSTEAKLKAKFAKLESKQAQLKAESTELEEDIKAEQAELKVKIGVFNEVHEAYLKEYFLS